MDRKARKHWRPVLAIIAAALVAPLAACATGPSQSTIGGTGASSALGAMPGMAAAGTAVSAGTNVPATSASPKSGAVGDTQRLVAVSKTIQVETADVDRSIATIRALAERDGADITDLQVATASGQSVTPPPEPLADGAGTANLSTGRPLRAFVTLRVPPTAYASFVAAASALGRVLYQSESQDDVTQQHIDLTARLMNLQAEEARLRQMFSKAGTVRDALLVEDQLATVEGDIESLQGQIDFLERQAAMATVTIEMVEPTPIVSSTGSDWGVRAAVTDAIRGFVGTMNALIVILGPALAVVAFVLLPIGLVAWLVVVVARKRRRAKGMPARDGAGA